MLEQLPAEKLNRLFSLLSFVPMPKREKHLWVKMAREMNEAQLDKLLSILERQASQMTDIAIKALERRTKNETDSRPD